jgi:hypothetical protein
MELNIDFSDMTKQFDEKEIKNKIKRSIQTMAFECEASAKKVISNNSIDTGQFLNSIWSETWEKGDEIGFTMYDGVEYGIHHEYGTIRHWVPFYYYNDINKPVLAPWGARVLKLSQEEMLAMGGIEVEISESMPFRKALLEIENNAKEIFGKEFKK